MRRFPYYLFVLFSGCDDGGPKESVTVMTECAGGTCPETYDDADGDYYASEAGDCDDNDPAVNPGATETCDGVDQDCDGLVDDEPSDGSSWYLDEDGDGHGAGESTVACEAPESSVAGGDDCDDADPAFYPGADEPDCNDLNDYNCDGSVAYEDADGDGQAACLDCNDADPSVALAGTELCNGLDDDCDGLIDEEDAEDAATWYSDNDRDGYGATGAGTQSCFPPPDTASMDGDCDDADPAVNPGAAETDCADPTDYNCDGAVGYADTDGDGFPACEDCDDSDAAVSPAGVERCDGQDEDCDGDIDEDAADASTWYLDADGDGFGGETTAMACEVPAGHVGESSDCDDNNAAIAPGAAEYCNRLDDDCDGELDEANAIDAGTWYTDGDSDGWGESGTGTPACEAPGSSVAADGDCDDADPAFHPGAAEADCADPNDYNCDGLVGYLDNDGDTFAACDDCDDNDPAVSPVGIEACDGVDNDCDGEADEDEAIDAGTWYTDSDGDGWGQSGTGALGCEAPEGSTAAEGDCDDADPAFHPGADEPDCTDPSDYNCDDLVGYADSDGDAFAACEDCDDSDAAVSPAGIEACNGVDDDCDGEIDEDEAVDVGTWYGDGDGDGYGDPAEATRSCDAPPDTSASGDDCDDADPDAWPGGVERCDAVDNDCDGVIDEADAADAMTWYADADEDGYGDPTVTVVSCAAPDGYVADPSDCDDAAAPVNPGATEVCDALDTDEDCSGAADDADPGATGQSAFYLDDDADGHGDVAVSVRACDAPTGHIVDNTDCDDGEGAINPGATEVCDSANTDEDCSGAADDADPGVTGQATWYLDGDEDGYGDAAFSLTTCDPPADYISDATDCDDEDIDVSPAGTDVCSADRDCDGVPGDTCGSCAAHLATGSDTDGLYVIDPDGVSGSQVEVEVWCDMSTSGGGWTLVQRTVWAWAETSLLDTGYATWYGTTLGLADPGEAFRLAGQAWSYIAPADEIMAVHTARDQASGADCEPLFYTGTGADFTVTSSSATLSSAPSSAVFLMNSLALSTADSGASSICVNSYDAVPWFYSYCCTTCPSFKYSYWTDEAHPMASYINTTADLYGNMDAEVCPSGRSMPNQNGSVYEGINVMEYYLR